MKLLLSIFFITIFINVQETKCQNILKGYKILNIARKDLPLGAQWINGVGPDGNGVGKDNIRFTESIDYLSIDDEIKMSIISSITSYLGISGDYAKKINIHCKNLYG
ncbi:hypothetical protein QWY86_09850 [Pedobacter aquatilis]|uniref:hypothetical protein n=1 Tax=Pedobacter aquatilis TaxID=351343 RepID=UPI0025B330BE|nr:hypothetical protein [Pedobacter aquatilis]MDN3586971.1 hypothetical protein [Pedobacter aquatilis]